MIDLTMKPTGWFQVAWSGEIPVASARPLKAFGRDLVAYRTETGELVVLDAHCRHLGAHLGYRGTVIGDCVQCPYHGWRWGPDGSNALIPYQEQPSRSRLGRWDVVERHGLVFLWHDPNGGGPRPGWDIPDLFTDFPEVPTAELGYHEAFPHVIVDKRREPIHPQLVQENTCDSMHFRYSHGAPEDPQLLHFEHTDTHWRSAIGFLSPKTKQVALKVHNYSHGIGLNFAVFDGGAAHYRLILTATPVDDDTSDLRVSYFLPRLAESPDELTEAQRGFAVEADRLFEEDAVIWRHQVFVQKPVYARQDVAGYTALRNWCARFYEQPAAVGPTPMVPE